MDFKNRVKGSVTQTLFKALLEDAGYQLVPLGIEEVIREVKALPISQYMDLGLPPVLGRMPDFFIADKSFKETWLVEVKYRKQWNDNTRASLGREIEEQVKIWQPISLVLFLGERARETDTPASSIGVLRLIHAEGELLCSWFDNDFFTNELKEYRTPWDEIEWGTFHRFQDVFTEVGTQWEESTLIKAQSVLNSLKDLDMFE